MDIIKVKMYDPRFGWSILIKDFKDGDYKKLLSIVKKLNLKRDLKMERKMRIWAGKVKRMGISREYDYLAYTYSPEYTLIGITWFHPKINGEEFMSIWLSN